MNPSSYYNCLRKMTCQPDKCLCRLTCPNKKSAGHSNWTSVTVEPCMIDNILSVDLNIYM